MGIYDLMQSYRGAALNIRHINLRHDAVALGGKANFRKCIERIQKDGGNSDNIFITDAVYNNIVYIEQENGVYIEIFPLSLDMIEFIRFKDRLEWLREEQKKFIEQENYEMFYANIPKPYYIFDFEYRYKSISTEHLVNAWTSVYTRLDYGFSGWKKETLNDVFSVAKSATKQENDKKVDKPDKMIRIYRGEGSKSTPVQESHSWTTDINVALSFACHGTGTAVWTGTIQESDIIMQVNERDEAEVIVSAADIKDIQQMNMYPADEDTVLNLIRMVYDDYIEYGNIAKKLYNNNENNFHELSHTARVLLNSLIIARELDLDDDETIILAVASVFHDIGRENDCVDENHGLNSVNIFIEHKNEYSYLSESDIEVIKSLIAFHCIPDKVGEERILKNDKIMDKKQAILLYQVFKDADALDRFRLGHYKSEFDFNMLRLEASRKLLLVSAEFVKRRAESLIENS